MPLLTTPSTLWRETSELAAKPRDEGLNLPSMDLLIAVVGIPHQVILTTFGGHFGDLAQICGLRAHLLIRPE